jgi:Tfp pilus assembly protein PilN
MRAVNLLPRETTVVKTTKASNVVPIVAAAGGLVVVIALAAAVVTANGHVTSRRAALARAKTELAKTPARNDASLARNTLLSQRDLRAVALAAALSRRVAWDRILRRLALVLPDDVWLVNLTGDTPSSTTDTASTTTATGPGADQTPTGLTLEGYSYSHDAVARLLSRLAVVPDLKNVQLQKSTAELRGGMRVVHFTIAADVRRAGDTP